MMCARGVSQDMVSRPYPLRESCQIPHGMAAGHLGTLQGVTAPRWGIHGCAVHIGLKHSQRGATPADPLGGFQRAIWRKRGLSVGPSETRRHVP